MLKIRYVNNLMNAYEMLKDYNNEELSMSEIKKLKKDFKTVTQKDTSTIDTLKREKIIVKIDRVEDVTITLKRPTEIKEVYINGQKSTKRIDSWKIAELRDLGLTVEVKEKQVSELQVKKYFYQVDLKKLEKIIEKVQKKNQIVLEQKIKDLESDLETYKKLLNF